MLNTRLGHSKSEEMLEELLHQLSYAIKIQLKAPKAPKERKCQH